MCNPWQLLNDMYARDVAPATPMPVDSPNTKESAEREESLPQDHPDLLCRLAKHRTLLEQAAVALAATALLFWTNAAEMLSLCKQHLLTTRYSAKSRTSRPSTP